MQDLFVGDRIQQADGVPQPLRGGLKDLQRNVVRVVLAGNAHPLVNGLAGLPMKIIPHLGKTDITEGSGQSNGGCLAASGIPGQKR